MSELVKEKADTIYTLARQFVDESEGDRSLACRTLAGRLNANPDLLMPIIDSVSRVIVGKQLRHTRKAIERSNDRARERMRINGMKSTMRLFWLDYPMIDGTRLGDSDRYTVNRTADNLIEQGQVCMRKGRFFQSIAQSLSEGQKVSDVLSEGDIDDRWQSTSQMEIEIPV